MNFRDLANELFELIGKSGPLKNNDVQEFPKGEIGILMYLYLKSNGISAGHLSKTLKISTARIAFALNNLERKKLIERKMDSSDKRKVVVYITENGKKKAKEKKEFVINKLTTALSKLGEKDALEFIRLITKIIEIKDEMEKIC